MCLDSKSCCSSKHLFLLSVLDRILAGCQFAAKAKAKAEAAAKKKAQEEAEGAHVVVSSKQRVLLRCVQGVSSLSRSAAPSLVASCFCCARDK